MVAIAAGSALMWLLLQRRVRPLVAVAGALGLGASQGLVRMASVVWSEAPYVAIALAMMVVLSRSTLTNRSAAAGGLLAGLGFLTRYAAVGLMVSGAVMVLASAWRDADRAVLTRRFVSFTTAALGVCAVWVIRNLVETGQPLGPRFEGGAHEPLTRTVRLALIGTGNIVMGDGWTEPAMARIGAAIFVAVALMAWFALGSRRATTVDLGVAVFAATSFVVPIVARVVTANDIELRVMSPILIPLVLLRRCRRSTGCAPHAASPWQALHCSVGGCTRAPPSRRVSQIWHPVAAGTKPSSRRSCTTSSTPCRRTPRSSPTTLNACGGSPIGSRRSWVSPSHDQATVTIRSVPTTP